MAAFLTDESMAGAGLALAGMFLFLHLPPALVDWLLFAVQCRTVGDLGLAFPTEGAMTQPKARGAGVAVVDARRRRISPTRRSGSGVRSASCRGCRI